MVRSVLILLLGSGVAQLGPLLLAPLLSRLYPPEVFGLFHLATAVATNAAVVACARYEFALPLAADEAERQRLHRLSRRILWGVVGFSALLAALAWGLTGLQWPWAIPPTVAALGYLSLWTMRATAAQAVVALAWARVGQFWGGGLIQAGLGLLQVGLVGLLIGPAAAAAAAALGLRASLPRPAGPVQDEPLLPTARRWRDFPLLNTPHAFLGALQDTLTVALIASLAGAGAAGVWAVSLRLLKAPATLAGSAVAQVLYPRLGAEGGPTAQARSDVRRWMALLGVLGAGLAVALALVGPGLMPWLLGPGWEDAGPLASALAVYLGLHFVASPLAVVTMAWKAQAWALKASVLGQALFLLALAGPLLLGGTLTQAAGWVSLAMTLFFGGYFWRLATWPLQAYAAAE